MTLDRRTFLTAATGALVADSLLAQPAHHAHPALPVAPSATEPYARLQGGQVHHLTADQTAQRAGALLRDGGGLDLSLRHIRCCGRG